MEPVYLDHAATTPLCPEVREAMRPFLEEDYGNPSSRHPAGLRAAEALERARERVARVLGARPEGVVFTSGGTEANNLAVLGLARAGRGRGRHVLIGPTEHPSVREAGRALEREGFEVETGRLVPGGERRGELDLEHLAGRLRPDTVLVAQMLVNNELGSIYPVRALARLVRARAPGARLHVDAVQGLGKLDVDLEELGADSVAVSAHKVHGPKGAGALALAPEVRPEPLTFGGGQEGGLRSGTENVAGIAGLGRAVQLAEARRGEAAAAAAEARAVLCAAIEALPGASVLEPGSAVVPNILAVLLPGAPAEVYLHHLETRGVFVGTGSACQSKKRALSPALLALGLDEGQARRVLRLSTARTTTRGEAERAAAALIEVGRELEALAG